MTRSEILNTALEIVEGARQEQYGSPEDNFRRIAELWSTYLSCAADIWYDDQRVNLDATNVAVMMILLKIARLNPSGGPDDCWVDICGYAACGGALDG